MKDAEEVSNGDRQFLQVVEEKATKAGEHYVVPLPFWNAKQQKISYEEIDPFEGQAQKKSVIFC